jgi:tetratricopeptide (TPR) repeat protein
MKALCVAFRLGLLIGFGIEIPSLPAMTQASSPKETQSPATGLPKLTGDDAKRSDELDKTIEAALKADRWDDAIARSEELLALRTRAQGPKHFETVNEEWRLKTLRRVAPMPGEDRVAYRSAKTMDEQAEAFHAQGKYAEAQPLFEKALEIRRRLLSDDHPDTTSIYDRLANNLKAQGKYTAAQSLYEQALEINRRLLGDDHPDTANSYNNLANNLGVQGKLATAQPLLEKSLAIYRRLFGDDHPLTATGYNNLAVNLSRQGRYAVAQPLFEKSLEIRRGRLGDDHPDTAQIYSNLAAVLDLQGKYAAAQPLVEKALEIRRGRLGDDHPDTALGYNNLAENLRSQGRYVAAQPLAEKALEIRRGRLGDDHPDTAQSYNNLAANLTDQGMYAAAQPLFEKGLEIRRRLLTDDHPDTAASYNNLAYNLRDQGKYAQAQPLYEKALALFRRLQRDDHPVTAQSYNNLAQNLHSQGKYAAAQPLFEKALEINRRLLSDDHPNTAICYNNVADNLKAEGKYAAAQPLYEKAIETWRRQLGDDHPLTAISYHNMADNLRAQGKFAAAQPLYEKALEIRHRLLGDDHPDTVASYNNLAYNLKDQRKYLEACDRWQSAVKGQDKSRLRVAFTGLERVGVSKRSARCGLAAVLARLGQPAEAWQVWEEDLGRGLLDELTARQDQRLAPAERDRLRELTAELERLDKLVETTPRDLDQADRAKRFAELQHKRELASIALGEFQTKLVQDHDPRAGRVAGLDEIQAGLPADTALVAWVDIAPVGSKAADPDGEHWGVVVRSQGTPAWVPITGTGQDGLWTKDDTGLAADVRTELRRRPETGTADARRLVERLRTQRLGPLAKALGGVGRGSPDTAQGGLPPARRLIVLPSRVMAGIPVEALLTPGDTRTVTYAPSATVYKYLREQPRPDRHVGLLALGDPAYGRPDKSIDTKPLPEHGLLVNVVAPGSNAATHGLKPGDVVLAYNGLALKKKEDLKVVAEGEKPIVVDLWRDGQSSRGDLAPGKLGVVLDLRPAPEAIAEIRKLKKVLVEARTGSEDFASLPGTRYEVEALAKLFKADDRPTRILLGADASEPELDRLTAAGELGRFGFIHLATHGVIDEAVPTRSAVILTQTGLPDPLEQALNHKPVFDGRLSVREIQRGWDLKAELVTLSACETALGRDAGGEGFVGFTQALLMSGTRSVCLSLWQVDDRSTALLMRRFYANLLGGRPGLSQPMPKAEALAEAKTWLRNLDVDEVGSELAALERGGVRPLAKSSGTAPPSAKTAGTRPYDHPYYWAAFVLVGDPD